MLISFGRKSHGNNTGFVLALSLRERYLSLKTSSVTEVSKCGKRPLLIADNCIIVPSPWESSFSLVVGRTRLTKKPHTQTTPIRPITICLISKHNKFNKFNLMNK